MFYLSSGPQYLLLMGGKIDLRWENKRWQMHNVPPNSLKETDLFGVLRKSRKILALLSLFGAKT